MRFDALYEFCSSLPHATLSVQWGDHDVFKVGGKMFAILTQDIDVGFRLSLKADPEEFDELCGEHGVRPAPYMARNQWVQVVADNSLGHERLRSLVARSHGLVLEKLPAKQRRALDGAPAAAGEAAPRGRSPRSPRPPASGGAKRAAGKVEAAKKRTTTRASVEVRTAAKRAGTTGRTTASVGATKRTSAKRRTDSGKGAEKRTTSKVAGPTKRAAKGTTAASAKRAAEGTTVVPAKRAAKGTTAPPAKRAAAGTTAVPAKRATKGKAVTTKARGKAAGAAKRARG
jgi:predicted DNA-binding protein (MmcQ/YjbR family)